MRNKYDKAIVYLSLLLMLMIGVGMIFLIDYIAKSV